METVPSPESAIREYASEMDKQMNQVFTAHPDLYDHRSEHPWLTGWLGDPFAKVWFLAENPSLSMMQRQQRRYAAAANPETQWAASRGDQLFRQMLVKHESKEGTTDSPGGWNCYITNVVKEADYTSRWREKTKDLLFEAAEIWAPVLRWELEATKPRLVVVMGKQPRAMIDHLRRQRLLMLPRSVDITHYAYIGQRAQGKLGPMHPDRVAAYGREFGEVVRLASR